MFGDRLGYCKLLELARRGVDSRARRGGGGEREGGWVCCATIEGVLRGTLSLDGVKPSQMK